MNSLLHLVIVNIKNGMPTICCIYFCMLAAMMSSVQSPWHERCNVGIFVCVINTTFVIFLVQFCLNK